MNPHGAAAGARPPQAGSAFERPWAHLFRPRDGRVARFVGMYDTATVVRARPAVLG